MLAPFLLVFAPLAAPPQTVGASRADEFVSSYFALRAGPAGKRVRALRAGAERAAVPPDLVLDGAHAVFGPGEVFVLLQRAVEGRRDEPGARRGVQLFGARLTPLASFTIGAEEQPVVGASAIALRTRAEHARGGGFRIEFVDLSGSVLRTHRRDNLVLLSLRELPGGTWASVSVDLEGAHHVHAFGADGALLFEHVTGAMAAPVVASSPAGDVFAIGSLDADAVGSRLELFDRRGRVVVGSNVPAFRAAVFRPDGERVVLVGRRSLTYVRTGDGELLWSLGRAEAYALGTAAAFSADGRELRTVAVAGERGKPGLVLETLTDLDRQPAAARRALTEVESTPGSRVLELRETNGDWQLVTRSGVWPLQR